MSTTANPRKLSVILVSYNTRELTLKAINSLIKQTKANYKLIVIDNASTDGSVESIQSRFPDIRFIKSTKNLGFAAANNLAASYANGDYKLTFWCVISNFFGYWPNRFELF